MNAFSKHFFRYAAHCQYVVGDTDYWQHIAFSVKKERSYVSAVKFLKFEVSNVERSLF